MVQPAKRAFDVLVSGMALAALWPILGARSGCQAVLTRPGAVQSDTGQAQAIKVYKFRSMVVSAENRTRHYNFRRRAGDSYGASSATLQTGRTAATAECAAGGYESGGAAPEDPHYVAMYTPEQRRVLQVPPGITSPASLYYRDEESLLNGQDWKTQYIQQVMPAKLAIDLEYVTKANLGQKIFGSSGRNVPVDVAARAEKQEPA